MSVRQFLTLILVAYCAAVWAAAPVENPPVESAFPIPDGYNLVNDYLMVLDISTGVNITKKLQALEKRNGTQIVFLSVPSTGKENIRDYAIKVATKWDIGNNGQGNGVLFLQTQKQGFYIFTGAGIAGAIPDAKVRRIITETIEPLMRQGKFSEGIEAGIDELIKAAQGEDTKPTSYDYANLIIEKWENLLIALLALIGTVYAGILLWRRLYSREKPEIS